METEINQNERALEGYQTELNHTQADINKLQGELDNLAFEDLSNRLSNVGNKMVDVGKTLSTRVSAPLTAFGALSVKTAADFDTAMSQVAATMGMTSDEINNGSKDFEALSAAARKMGSETQFSATEAAEALTV